MSWISNPWVIGIIGGIPSGFIVNWLSRYALGKREDREYLQKVIGANREIIYAVRPGISEGQIPSSEVLHALINATARRYRIEASDLYSPSQTAEELIKEVMDSSFISSTQKAEYCTRLATLGKVEQNELVPRETKSSETGALIEYRSRLVSSMSLLLGLLTTVITIMVSLLELVRSKRVLNPILFDKHSLSVLVPAIAAIATVSITLLAFIVFRDVARRKSLLRENEYLSQITMELHRKRRKN